MAKRGRKPKYNWDEVARQLDEYTDATDIPIVAEFCYLNGIRRESLYNASSEHEELKFSIKRCIDKKEAVLERGALEGKLDKTMAIFSLKQLGWKDKHEVEHSGAMDIEVTIKE